MGMSEEIRNEMDGNAASGSSGASEKDLSVCSNQRRSSRRQHRAARRSEAVQKKTNGNRRTRSGWTAFVGDGGRGNTGDSVQLHTTPIVSLPQDVTMVHW